MIKCLKTGLLVCTLISLVTVTIVAISILSQIAIDHTTRYLESYEGITKVETFIEAEKHAERLLNVTEEAIRNKNATERELKALKKVTDDLYRRLNNKENTIVEYCQATQDLSRSNEILIRKLNYISFLVHVIIEKLPEEDKEEARKRYMNIMADGGRTQ